MRTSESFGAVAAALFLARSAMPTLRRRGENPDTKSKYVKFEDMVPLVRKTLAARECFVMQSAVIADRVVNVETRIIHAPTGEWIETDCALPLIGRTLKGGGKAEADAQAGGSTITYARRYGLAAALCLVADEDDDGRAARAPEPQASPTAQAPVPAVSRQLAKARAYKPGSFVMPFGKIPAMQDVPDETLNALLQYAKDNTIPHLVLDVEMALADRAKVVHSA